LAAIIVLKFGNLLFEEVNDQNDVKIHSSIINISGFTIDIYHKKIVGKIFNLKIYIIDEKGIKCTQYPIIIGLGSLNSIIDLIDNIKNELDINIQKLYFDRKEINFKENRSLLSLGIKKDSVLYCVRT